MQSFIFGSVPLRTYLPDGDIDISCFAKSGHSLRDTWASILIKVLETEASSVDAPFQLRDIQLIQAEVKLIKCVVAEIVVDISFDTLGGLCTAAFLESIDREIGQSHLFKKSIVLIKAWCYYEARLLGAHHGLISSYALEAMVLYALLMHGNEDLDKSPIHGPLDVLRVFLALFASFPWEECCLSLQGPIPISTFPTPVADTTLLPPHPTILSDSFINGAYERYGVEPSLAVQAAGSLRGQKEPPLQIVLPLKFLNIVDPLLPSNNLGRSVSRASFARIRRAFAHGARKLDEITSCHDPHTARVAFSDFFRNTWRSQLRMTADNQEFLSHMAHRQGLARTSLDGLPHAPYSLPGSTQMSPRTAPGTPTVLTGTMSEPATPARPSGLDPLMAPLAVLAQQQLQQGAAVSAVYVRPTAPGPPIPIPRMPSPHIQALLNPQSVLEQNCLNAVAGIDIWKGDLEGMEDSLCCARGMHEDGPSQPDDDSDLPMRPNRFVEMVEQGPSSRAPLPHVKVPSSVWGGHQRKSGVQVVTSGTNSPASARTPAWGGARDSPHANNGSAAAVEHQQPIQNASSPVSADVEGRKPSWSSVAGKAPASRLQRTNDQENKSTTASTPNENGLSNFTLAENEFPSLSGGQLK